MRILFLGDIVGQSGRNAVISNLPSLRKEWQLDFIIVNAENTSAGMGLSKMHAQMLLETGMDCLTLGDHAFDQKDMLAFCEQESRIIRPINYAKKAPGQGARIFTLADGRKIMVAQALGQVFMRRPFDDPFSAMDTLLTRHPLGRAVQAIILDFHAEATSEKMAMGQYCDGRCSLVVGTHTHIPTADAQILPKGTAYQSDAGMCGDYNSIIGMEKGEPLRRFLTGMSKGRFVPATEEATLCGTFIETDERTGLANKVKMVRVGGRLSQECP